MKKTFIILFTFSFLLTACGKPISTTEIKTDTTIKSDQTINVPKIIPTEVTANDISIDTTVIKKSYTSTEVAEHSNRSSCWLILDNKVYDVTLFIAKHPSGVAILKGCGKDATQIFSKHPESAKTMKETYYIGELKV